MKSVRPSLQDRLLRRTVPRQVASYRPPLQPICPEIWVLERQLCHFGFAILPARTTIVRLSSNQLVVVSPPPLLDESSADALRRLGEMAHLVIPNSFHYLYTLNFLEHFPEVRVWRPPSLDKRRPELAFAFEIGVDTPSWKGELDYTILGPVRGLCEVLLFHHRSQTLILTDLAFNMTRYPRRIDRLFWRLSGIPRRFGPGRTSRSLLLSDTEIASCCLRQAARWPVGRIVVAHGAVVEAKAADEFRRAFAEYLEASS